MQISVWGGSMQSNQVLQIELLFCQYLPGHGNGLVPADQSLLDSTLRWAGRLSPLQPAFGMIGVHIVQRLDLGKN